MKKRTLVIAVLLVAALALGIGYAALSDTLTLNGTIKSTGDDMTDTFDGLVYFTNATVTNSPATHITANVSAAYGGDEASYTITGMDTVGDVVEMEFVIHNAYTETVWVSLGAHDENNNECVKITNNYTEAIEIAANSNATFTVTVEIVKLTGEGIDLTHNVTFNVSDEDPNPAP